MRTLPASVIAGLSNWLPLARVTRAKTFTGFAVGMVDGGGRGRGVGGESRDRSVGGGAGRTLFAPAERDRIAGLERAAERDRARHFVAGSRRGERDRERLRANAEHVARETIFGQLRRAGRVVFVPHVIDDHIDFLDERVISRDVWDEAQRGTRLRRLIVSEHADSQAIGVIEESGHPKQGDPTAGVSRQYGGHTGKIDNGVMAVHLTYTSFDGKFRTMLDSSWYLPQCWPEDRERCRQAKIPTTWSTVRNTSSPWSK